MNVRSQALKRQTKRSCAVTARLKSRRSLNQGRATRLMECARLRSIRSGHRSAPNLPQHRTCLSTEPASAPNTVRCYHESILRVNEKCHFGTQATARRVLAATIRRWGEQRMRISEFTAYSLLFTVISGKEKSRIPVIPDAAGGCTESSVARWPFVKKFADKFADKFAVPRTPVNYAGFALNPLLYRQRENRDSLSVLRRYS